LSTDHFVYIKSFFVKETNLKMHHPTRPQERATLETTYRKMKRFEYKTIVCYIYSVWIISRIA